MSKKDGVLNIEYGFAADSLAKQISEQGFKLPKDIEYLEKCREAALQLKFLLSDSENASIIKKLNKQVVFSVKVANRE